MLKVFLTKLNIFLVLLFLQFDCTTSAQIKNKLDSISRLITKEKSDSIKLKYYVSLCDLCPYSENLKYGKLGFDFAQKLIISGSKELSQEMLYKKQVYFLGIQTIYYSNLREYYEPIELTKKMIEIAEKTNDTLLLESTYNKLSLKLQDAGQFDAAFDVLFGRLKKYENISKRIAAFYQNNIGEFYYNNHNNKKALLYFEKALPYYLENNKFEQASQILLRISEQYDLIGDNKKAISACLKNLNIIRQTKDELSESNTLFRLANIYIAENNLEEADKSINRMIQIAETKNDSSELAKIYWVKAIYFQAKGNKQKEEECLLNCLSIYQARNDSLNLAYRLSSVGIFYLDNAQYQKAITALERGLEIAKKLKEIDTQKEFWNLLYVCYKKINNSKEALIAFENFKKMEDSSKNIRNQSAIEQREHILQFEKKQSEAKLDQEKRDIVITKEKEKEKIIRYTLIAGLTLVILLFVFIFRNYRIKMSANHSLTQQNKIILEQKARVEEQKFLIEERQKEIYESITYAKRLQEAILPPLDLLQKNLKDFFIYYQPKDIVAGDFYWSEEVGDKFYLAAADSTGHGVPGAMVSVVCSGALSRSVKEFGRVKTGEILDKTRELVIETFSKSNTDVKDGMDVSLICIDRTQRKIYWSGANNPLWYIVNGEMKEIKADKQPIGKTTNANPFTTHEIEYSEGASFYLFTDGYADQFGGSKGKKFKYKQMNELLLSNHHLSMNEQLEILKTTFNNWKGELEQVDDVCVIGVRI